MERDEAIRILAEFFLDEFSGDAIGVGEWLAQGGTDADDFIIEVRQLKAELSELAEG